MIQVKHWAIVVTIGVCSALALGCGGSAADKMVYQEGDFIFQDLDCGPLCDAIETVTVGVNGSDFSHIGLVVSGDDGLQVLEAIGDEVQLTPIDTFLKRTDNYVVSRLSPPWREILPTAIEYGKSKVGTPYDDAFLPDNEQYYCSELIAECFEVANSGLPFFEQAPMTFIDPATGEFFPAWVDYYAELGIPIPEGELGCNPGSISLDRKLEVIYRQ